MTTARASKAKGAGVMHFSMPRELERVIRRDAESRFETLSQWFRNVAVRALRQRGALPKK